MHIVIVADCPQKAAYTKLKPQHFELAARIFGTEDLDRLFVVHALAAAVRN